MAMRAGEIIGGYTPPNTELKSYRATLTAAGVLPEDIQRSVEQHPASHQSTPGFELPLSKRAESLVIRAQMAGIPHEEIAPLVARAAEAADKTGRGKVGQFGEPKKHFHELETVIFERQRKDLLGK